MSDLILLLSDKKKLNWSFASGRLSGSMSYVRASSGARCGQTGWLETLGADQTRFDFDPSSHACNGLLIEPQRTNLHTRSCLPSLWTANNGAMVVDNVYASPDGSQNASQITAGVAYGGRYINLSSGVSSGMDYSVSGFVRSFSGSSILRVGAQNAEESTNNAYLHIDTSSGSLVSAGAAAYDATCTLWPNGWTRFSYRIRTGSSQSSVFFIAFAIGGGSVFSVWGAQVEQGWQASSFIYTAGTTATRAADTLSLTIPSGVNGLKYVFDDDSTQELAVSSGVYTLPTNLSRLCIKRIEAV
ncbi:MAG: hypothetical protein PHW63_05705 [Alphaproteobacteria bacterium]|nr:hypothetical protein [Alphaproteobacteria bacterium]